MLQVTRDFHQPVVIVLPAAAPATKSQAEASMHWTQQCSELYTKRLAAFSQPQPQAVKATISASNCSVVPEVSQ